MGWPTRRPPHSSSCGAVTDRQAEGSQTQRQGWRRLPIYGRLSTFRRGFVSTFSLDVVGRGLSAIATVLFIRTLGVDSFAYLVLFLTVGQFAGGALTGGVRTRYLRAEAERVSRGHERATGFALALLTGLGLIVGTGLLFWAGVSLVDGGDREFVLLATLYTAGHASIELAMFHYQAHLRFSKGGTVGVARSVSLLTVAVLATLGVIGSGPAVAGAAAAGIAAVAAIACFPLIRQTLSVPARAALGGHFGSESAWLTLYYLASAGFAYANVFVVASLLDDEAIASYGAAIRYLAIVLGPVPALLAVLRVRTSQHDVVDSTKVQTNMLLGWIKQTILPAGAAVGIAALTAPFFIPLLNSGNYPDTVPIFQLLMIAALVIYTTMPGASMLMAQRRYRTLATIYAVALLIEVVAAVLAAELGGVIAVAATAAVVGAGEAATTAFVAMRIGVPVEEPAAPGEAQPSPTGAG
jgi:O-antigen/teichoic acid export membrane protein